jgi:hypothetical protein
MHRPSLLRHFPRISQAILSENFLRAVSDGRRRAAVPGEDRSIRVRGEDGVVDTLDDGFEFRTSNSSLLPGLFSTLR